MRSLDFTEWTVTATKCDENEWEAGLEWPGLSAAYDHDTDASRFEGYTWRDHSIYQARANAIGALAYALLDEERREAIRNRQPAWEMYSCLDGHLVVSISQADTTKAALAQVLRSATETAMEAIDYRGDDTPMAESIRADQAATERRRRQHARAQQLAFGDPDLARDLTAWSQQQPDADAVDRWLDNHQAARERALAERAADAHDQQTIKESA